MKTIVLDTNIWLSELALMSPLGCAFNHYVTVSGFKIGLPEVVEEEAKHNFRKNLLKYRSDIEKNYRLMLAIFGKMKELVVPSNEDIERKVESIFDFHKDRIIRVPFEIKGARSSFDKIIKKEPPSTENRQQFKDGVIWANCLELAKSSEVLLVTSDPDFYKERNIQKGLAENLLLEAQNVAYTISIYSQLSDLLKEIKRDLKLDEAQIVKLIEKETLENILKIAERLEFSVGKLINRKFEIFATTDPKKVSVKFFLKYDLENKSTEHRINAYAESEGEFLLNIENYDIEDFRNLGEYVFWINEAGELKKQRNIYESINIVLGTIQLNTKYPTNWGNGNKRQVKPRNTSQIYALRITTLRQLNNIPVLFFHPSPILSLNLPKKVIMPYFTFSKSSKNLSRDIPAVVIFVRICVTGTSLGLVFITKGLFIPAFVIMI